MTTDAFVSDAAVRAKYRTPIEKLVGIIEATGSGTQLRVAGKAGARRQVLAGIGEGLFLISQAHVDGEVGAQLNIVLHEHRPERIARRSSKYRRCSKCRREYNGRLYSR